jgi:hypothetical protein
MTEFIFVLRWVKSLIKHKLPPKQYFAFSYCHFSQKNTIFQHICLGRLEEKINQNEEK